MLWTTHLCIEYCTNECEMPSKSKCWCNFCIFFFFLVSFSWRKLCVESKYAHFFPLHVRVKMFWVKCVNMEILFRTPCILGFANNFKALKSWFLVSRHPPALYFHALVSIHYWDIQKKKSNFRQKKENLSNILHDKVNNLSFPLISDPPEYAVILPTLRDFKIHSLPS